VCKKLIKNSQPFGKKFQKTAGGRIFLTHTVYCCLLLVTYLLTYALCSYVRSDLYWISRQRFNEWTIR